MMQQFLVGVQNLRRESAHACTFNGDFELNYADSRRTFWTAKQKTAVPHPPEAPGLDVMYIPPGIPLAHGGPWT